MQLIHALAMHHTDRGHMGLGQYDMAKGRIEALILPRGWFSLQYLFEVECPFPAVYGVVLTE